MAGVEEISSKYASELNELRCNSKPLINSLTMMAEDYIRHAPVIVQTIVNHLRQLKVIVNKETKASTSSGSGSSPQIDASSDSNTNQKVMVNALGNHVVLEEIFKRGNFHDLKNFRLVNKYWKAIANCVIIQRRLWKLSFQDTLCGYTWNQNETFIELNDCIEASGGSFPLTTIAFSDVEHYDTLNLNSAALLRFYELMGQSIIRVKFNNFGSVTMDEFQDLLVNKIPNVDHIDAGKIVFMNEEKCRLPIIVLPNLKTIRFIGPDENERDEDGEPLTFTVLPYYKIVLLAAINLKEIQDFNIELTNIVSETGKMGCIQELKLDFRLEDSETLYSIFSHSAPKLTPLTITRPRREYEDYEFQLSPELGECLKRILNSSKDTLKHLHCQSGIFPVDFELPKFPNLNFLSVLVLDKYFPPQYPSHLPIVFPPRCDCREIFPNIHTFTLRFSDSDTFKTLYSYFPHQPLPSVNTLEVQGSCRFLRMGVLFEIVFPNVSHVKIIDYEYMTADARFYTGISNKGLYSDLGNQINSIEFNQCKLDCWWSGFQLDSLFTGVSRHRCGRLLGMYNRRKARGEDEDMRVVKNILEAVQTRDGNRIFLNSEGVRRIQINFNNKGNVDFRMSQMSDNCNVDGRCGSGEYFCECEQCPEYFEHDEEDQYKGVPSRKPIMTPVSCAYGFSLMPNLEQVIIGYDHTLPNASDFAQFFKPFAEFPYVKIAHEPTIWG